MTGVIKTLRQTLSPIAAAAVFALAFVVASPAAEPVDDETCLSCHDGYAEHLGRTAHRLSTETTSPKVELACVSCHSGGETHIEDPSAANISNPATAAFADQIETCSSCHQPHTEMNAVGFDPHSGQNLACADCHSVHSGTLSLLADDRGDFCNACHVGVKNEFRRVSNHPLNDGNVSCISCHDFTGTNEPDFGHGQTGNCYSCHPEQSGPYLFEHGAASSFAPDGGGCISCHAPHGSPNERLLVRTDNSLCQQCHGVPAGHRTVHDAIGQQYTCMECHSDVHGSYDNRSLLDPNLGSKIGAGPGSCWCHNVEN